MYGDLLDEYPVVPNSVWQFDKGLLICGSNLDLGNQEYIPVVDCVYTNPPRSNGALTMFYRFANLKTETTILGFLSKMFDLVKRKTQMYSTVYFDVGIKQSPKVLEIIEKTGWRSSGTFTTYYEKRPKPCYTMVGSFWETSIIPSNLNGMFVREKNSFVVSDLRKAGHKDLFDPCCGSSEYLVEGLKQGMESVYGIEIIPEKMALGLKRIEGMGYIVKRIK